MATASVILMSNGAAQANTAGWGATDIARQAGLFQYTRTYAAEVYDYNKDGFDDVFIPQHDPQAAGWGQAIPPAYLYESNGGTGFTRTALNPASDRHGCAFGDANGDGLPDLFCAVGLTASSVNELWLQQSDGSFVNVAKAAGITAQTHGRYRTSTFIDANGDGLQDIYVTRFTGGNGDPFNKTGRENPAYPNELWLNQGNQLVNGISTPIYKRAPSTWGPNDLIGAQKDNHACNQAIDYNNDGFQDLLVCAGAGLYLYRNDGGTGFTNIASSLGVGGNWIDAQLADLNNDGLPDLIEAKSGTVNILFQQPDHTFDLKSTFSIAMASNVAVGDFNGDGAPDVYVVGSCAGNPTLAPDNPDYVLMNGGVDGGFSFTPEQLPAIMPKGGCGDDVAAIKFAGQTDFLVLNGRRKEPGPTQLWSYSPGSTNPDTQAPDVIGPYNNFTTHSSLGLSAVPVNLSWYGTDQSGINNFELQKSTDGGSTWTDMPLPKPRATAKAFLMQPGSNEYEFRVRATEATSLGLTSGWTTGNPFQVGLDQETNPAFTYTGSWTPADDSSASAGTIISSSTAGDSVTYTSPPGAKWIAWAARKEPDGGRATVAINGNKVGTVNLYAARTKERWIVWYRAVGNGNVSNRITITVTGTASSGSTGTAVDIDAIAYQTGSTPFP